MHHLVRKLACTAGLFLSTACAGTSNGTDTGTTATLNTKCVVTGEPIDASSPTADFLGGKVAFCCKECLGKWNDMDEAAKKAALDKAK